MYMPHHTPARLMVPDQPIYSMAEFAGIEPQDWIRRIKCAAACVKKSGYAACLARCLVTGEACDGGLDNCDGV